MRKKILITLLIFVAVLAVVIAVVFVRLNIRTSNITADYSAVYDDPKYQTPVYVEGVDVITQDVSCGYAVIEMFSGFNGGDLTEDDLYSEYGRVVTSTGASFCDEMNKRFPEYKTSMYSYLSGPELIGLVYDSLSDGVPVPVIPDSPSLSRYFFHSGSVILFYVSYYRLLFSQQTVSIEQVLLQQEFHFPLQI